MGKFYIYNANIEDKEHKELTIIFNPNSDFDFNSLKKELTEFFRNFHQTSALVFMYCSKLINAQKLIEENFNSIFKSIPKVQEESLKENIFGISYDENSFSTSENFLNKNIKEIINQGLVNIFIENGGLVESNGISHHFVFPSGKHSAKFLRTANVLVKRSEIDFIALNTLHLFKESDFDNIYCDTLSITVVGYSMNNYLKRFKNTKEINVESFKSYDGLYNKDSIFYDNSIFLISASTSGGLVNYLQDNHPEIESKKIGTLFYLPIDKNSKVALERVVCNLVSNEKLGYGIELYDTSKPPHDVCKYCKNYSTAIQIIGDSFSLDEPIINTRNIIATKYISKSLKDFIEIFKYKSDIGTSLKVSYSEDSISRKKYNLYIDYEKIISNIDKDYFKDHKEKIDAYINQYVPASIKYIIHLNDSGSLKLSEYIYEKIEGHSKNAIKIINQSELKEDEIPKDEVGSILIIGSCITNGKNLLYLSRFFRNYENIRLVYFIGINRISDSSKYAELKSNIKYGLYGSENSSFIEIETINCDNSNSKTPWEIELDYLKNLRSERNLPLKFIDDRIDTINSFASIQNKGGTDEIFYSDINNKELQIRKNSAFFNNNEYYSNVSQSDVYFTISCVLNNMRNNKNDGLYQTSFVKNLLDPFIFNRFNDGIIQASILRSAKDEELNYSFSYKNSSDMVMLLKTLIEHIDEYQGEAIFEFLYALATSKLRLFKDHYKIVLEELDKINDDRINIFKNSIQEVYNNCL